MRLVVGSDDFFDSINEELLYVSRIDKCCMV